MFESTGAGDLVIVRRRSFVGAGKKEATVSRVTGTMVVIGGERFSKSTGRNCDGMGLSWLEAVPVTEPATPVAIAPVAASTATPLRSIVYRVNMTALLECGHVQRSGHAGDKRRRTAYCLSCFKGHPQNYTDYGISEAEFAGHRVSPRP